MSKKLTDAFRYMIDEYYPETSPNKYFCAVCEKELSNGDIVDSYYPWFTEDNRCINCLDVDRDTFYKLKKRT